MGFFWKLMSQSDNFRDRIGNFFAKERDVQVGPMTPSSSGGKAWLTVLIVLASLAVLFLVYLLIKKIKEVLRFKRDHKRFLTLCEEKNLTVHQIKILETLAQKNKIMPSLLLTSHRDLINLSLKEAKSLLGKYSATHPVYVDFNANIQHIRSVFYRKKPGYGEAIQSSRDIHTGANLILYFKDKAHPNPVKGSAIHVDDHQIAVKITENLSAAQFLIEKKKISVFFNHEGDANYDFETEILTHREISGKNDQSLILILAHSSQLRRRQRRKYIRVRTSSPLVINQAVMERQPVAVMIQGTMIDVSEGGCCFKSKDPIQVGAVVNMNFFLDGQEVENVVAKILRITAVSATEFLYHSTFLEITDEKKNKVKNFVLSHANRRV